MKFFDRFFSKRDDIHFDEFTAVESIARGQIVVIDPVHRTVYAATRRNKTRDMERDLKGWKP